VSEMVTKIEISEIEMDAFQGRNAHPHPTDGGKIGVVLRMSNTALSWAEPGGWFMDPDEDCYDVYFVVRLPDSRIVEIMECEVKRLWIEESDDVLRAP